MDSDENLVKIRLSAAQSGNILSAGISTTLTAADVSAIVEQVRNAPENIRAIWNLAQGEMKILDAEYQGTAHYSENERGVKFNLQRDKISPFQKPYRTFFHETAHFIDNWLEGYNGYRSVTSALGETLRQEAQDYIKAVAKSSQLENLDAACRAISAELRSIPNELQHEVSDLWQGASDRKVFGNWGHQRQDYWTENAGANLTKEAFAHMFCAAINNPAALIQIKKFFPKSHAIFEQMIEEAVKWKK